MRAWRCGVHAVIVRYGKRGSFRAPCSAAAGAVSVAARLPVLPRRLVSYHIIIIFCDRIGVAPRGCGAVLAARRWSCRRDSGALQQRAVGVDAAHNANLRNGKAVLLHSFLFVVFNSRLCRCRLGLCGGDGGGGRRRRCCRRGCTPGSRRP